MYCPVCREVMKRYNLTYTLRPAGTRAPRAQDKKLRVDVQCLTCGYSQVSVRNITGEEINPYREDTAT